MKKRYIVVIFVLVIISCITGNYIRGNGVITTHVRDLITSDYSRIKSLGSFDIVLVSDVENSISIKGDDNIIPYILTEVQNDSLIIKFQDDVNIRSYTVLEVTVPLNNNINEISLSGSGSINGKDVIISDNISLRTLGSGDMKMSLQAQNVFISIAGSGEVDVNGNTNTLKVNINGSGDVSAYDLVSKVATLTISGSGNIETTVNDKLTTTITGSGDIFYKGTPQVTVDISGSGKIRKAR